MNDTLLPLNDAYNSGKRSRANSFSAQTFIDGSAQPHRPKNDNNEALIFDQDDHNTSNLYLSATQATFRSRHSSFSAASPVLSPNLLPLDSAASPSNLELAHESEFDADLEAAFQEVLYMNDGVNDQPPNTNHEPLAFASMDEAYHQSLNRFAQHDALSTIGATDHLQPSGSRQAFVASSQHDLLHEQYRGELNPLSTPDQGATRGVPDVYQNQWLFAGTGHERQRYVRDRFADNPNLIHNVPSPLDIPVMDAYSNNLEVPSPYSDSASYDGTTYLDHGAVLPDYAISRSNSLHSQQHYLDHSLSQPTSPYPDAGIYSNSHPNLVTMAHSPGQTYGISHGVFNPLEHNLDLSDHHVHYNAPNIAINPPTPGASSLTRHAAYHGYPFGAGLPTITTTSAPSLHVTHIDAPNTDVSCLDVDHTARGRSHSDSGLLLLGDPRSPSSSSAHRSSSSGSRSPSQARRDQRLDIRSSSHSRISKADAHHRRASWSSTRDAIEREFTPRDGQQVNLKQKNPATFICPVEGCNKAFTRAYNLRSHQRTHTNERPFLCEVCGKGFARQHDRKRHEKLHTNEKPFECPGCKKTFARMDALSRHFRSENGKICIEDKPEYAHYLLDDTALEDEGFSP